jgi:hypothetical protein
MPQGVLNFKYEEEKKSSGMTALAGLPVYLDFSYISGLYDSIRKHVKIRNSGQGWTDVQVLSSLILLNLAGGDCVEDLRILESDEGFVEILRKIETYKLRRKERRELESRHRKEKLRSVPSPSSAFRYLQKFHNKEEEINRKAHKAFIPLDNEYLKGLKKVNGDLLSFIQLKSPEKIVTLDMDATVVESNKEEALYCYEGFKSYQPLNAYWAEKGFVVNSEFRDGNVPAGYEQLRVLKETIDFLPEGIEKIYLRSDTAGYQWDLMKYCAEGKNKRFGVIEFTISADVSPQFKEAVKEVSESDWTPLLRQKKDKKWEETGQEWAEVCYVPSAVCVSKKGPSYRYIAIREAVRQLDLPGMEQLKLPFYDVDLPGKGKYKISAIVTNRTTEGQELIWWHRKRCGKSEEVHSVMKEDLAGGKLPSGYFGVNAAWWAIMILAYNINSGMKRLVLGESWINKRLKAIRFAIINLPGRIIKRSRELIIRLTKGHPSNELLFNARKKILSFSSLSPG